MGQSWRRARSRDTATATGWFERGSDPDAGSARGPAHWESIFRFDAMVDLVRAPFPLTLGTALDFWGAPFMVSPCGVGRGCPAPFSMGGICFLSLPQQTHQRSSSKHHRSAISQFRRSEV